MGCSTGAPPTTRPRAAHAVPLASCSRCCSTSREKKRLWEPIQSARLPHHAVTSMSLPHPLLTTRAARIAIPCCSTYRHGHEQLSSRRDAGPHALSAIEHRPAAVVATHLVVQY